MSRVPQAHLSQHVQTVTQLLGCTRLNGLFCQTELTLHSPHCIYILLYKWSLRIAKETCSRDKAVAHAGRSTKSTLNLVILITTFDTYFFMKGIFV